MIFANTNRNRVEETKMRKNLKIIILTIVIIIGLITMLYYKNKLIDNHPQKSKLVRNTEWGQYNEQYDWRNIFKN